MALKADRHELATDISFFYNADTATRGGVAVIDTVGSGSAMDQSQAKVKYRTDLEDGAGRGHAPMGILLNDVVNLDLTRQHINWHKDEVQKGGKVTVLTQGWVVTNFVDTEANFGAVTAGQVAYASSGTAGYITNRKPPGNLGMDLAIGRFLSGTDEDGYYKVAVNLPQLGS